MSVAISSLVDQINQVDVGRFKLKAFFYDMGRTQIPNQRQRGGYIPLEATIDGVPIPHLSPEEQREVKGKIKMAALCDKLQQICNVGITLTTEEQADLLMKISDNINAKDFDISGNNTFQAAKLIMSKDMKKSYKGLLILAQMVLTDAQKGMDSVGIVNYFQVKRKMTMDMPFLSMDQGENILTLDPEFVNHKFCCDGAGSYVYDYKNPNPTQQDIANQHTTGMRMIYALKYTVIGTQLTVDGFGLVFLQFCTESSRVTKSPWLSKLFKDMLGGMGVHALLNRSVTAPTEQPCLCGKMVAMCDVCGKGWAQVSASASSQQLQIA